MHCTVMSGVEIGFIVFPVGPTLLFDKGQMSFLWRQVEAGIYSGFRKGSSFLIYLLESYENEQ